MRPTATSFAILDVAIVTGVSLLYVLAEALDVPKRWSFLAAGVVVAAFAIHLARRRSDSWRDLGFRADNLRASALPFAVATLVLAAALVAWGHASGRPAWSPESARLLALYPAWALAQQFVFQGVLHRRLMALVRRPALEVVIVAACFAGVHVGNATLVLLTFAAGVLWSCLFRRWPNLWLLAASHSVLAALAYPLVLADAPLSRM